MTNEGGFKMGGLFSILEQSLSLSLWPKDWQTYINYMHMCVRMHIWEMLGQASYFTSVSVQSSLDLTANSMHRGLSHQSKGLIVINRFEDKCMHSHIHTWLCVCGFTAARQTPTLARLNREKTQKTRRSLNCFGFSLGRSMGKKSKDAQVESTMKSKLRTGLDSAQTPLLCRWHINLLGFFLSTQGCHCGCTLEAQTNVGQTSVTSQSF